jgi:hypothetical protein
MHCRACDVDIVGTWPKCPLCRQSLDEREPEAGSSDEAPLPKVPLSFSRRGLMRALVVSSFVVIAISLAAQLLLVRDDRSVGWLRSVWLGVTCMWLLVLTAVRKRRNVAKAAVYLTVLVSAACSYWDFLTGWHRWSLTYAVPIVCTGAGLAVLIIVRAMRVETGEHILYTAAVTLLGVLPILFVVFGWSSNPWTGIISACVSAVVLLLLPSTRGREIRKELAKRLHL